MESLPTEISVSANENELDALVVQILKLMNQYILCKKNIENHIRSGCLNLAKARYITGNRSISSLQLPTEDAVGINAKFKVSSRIENGIKQFKSIELDVNDITEDLNNINIDSDDTTKKIKRFKNDPLKWFGFLVPQNLKKSKVLFENCLEIVIECANIQSELLYYMDKYASCRKLLKCD